VAKESLEIKIGIFVVAGVLLLAAMILIFGEVEMFRNEYAVTAFFKESVGDVTPGVSVRFRGLRVGKAVDISLLDDGTVKVVLSVRENFDIKKDAKLVAVQTSFLGESYFDITPGSPGGDVLPKDGTAVMEGVVQSSLSELTPKVDRILTEYEPKLAQLMENLNNAITHFDKVVGDKESQAYFKSILKNTAMTMDRAPEIAANVARLVNSGNELVANLKKSAKTFDSQMTELGASYGKLGKDLNSIAQRLDNILASMQKISNKASAESTVGRLVSEDQLYEKMIETLDEARLTLAQIKKTVRYLEENPSAMFWGAKKRTPEKPWWQKLFVKEKEESAGTQGESGPKPEEKE